jgi:hypothetical protein
MPSISHVYNEKDLENIKIFVLEGRVRKKKSLLRDTAFQNRAFGLYQYVQDKVFFYSSHQQQVLFIMVQKVLVIGSTGNVGVHITEGFLKKKDDFETTVLVREDTIKTDKVRFRMRIDYLEKSRIGRFF